MTIDLRYVIVVAAFFAPAAIIRFWWFMWGLDFTANGDVAGGTLFMGLVSGGLTAAVLFFHENGPIRFTIGGKRDE